MPTPGGPPVCLECRERFAHSRGLCGRCYRRLGGQVRAGLTTWTELEAAGRAKPVRGSRWGRDYRR